MSREDSQALHDAYAKIQTLQMDVEALSNVSKKIVSDRGQIDDELSVRFRDWARGDDTRMFRVSMLTPFLYVLYPFAFPCPSLSDEVYFSPSDWSYYVDYSFPICPSCIYI